MRYEEALEMWDYLSRRGQWVDMALARRLTTFPQRHRASRPRYDWYKRNWVMLAEMAEHTLGHTD